MSDPHPKSVRALGPVIPEELLPQAQPVEAPEPPAPHVTQTNITLDIFWTAYHRLAGVEPVQARIELAIRLTAVTLGKA